MHRGVTAITKTAATLVSGLSRGRRSWPSIQIGKVSCCPAVKVVTRACDELESDIADLLEALGEKVDTYATSAWQQIAMLCGVGAALSSVMNNIGALAIVMPSTLMPA